MADESKVFVGPTQVDRQTGKLIRSEESDNRSWMRGEEGKEVYIGQDKSTNKEEPRWLAQMVPKKMKDAGGEMDMWELKEVLERNAKNAEERDESMGEESSEWEESETSDEECQEKAVKGEKGEAEGMTPHEWRRP